MAWLDLLLSSPDAPWSPPKWLTVGAGWAAGHEPSDDDLMDVILEGADKTPAPYFTLAKPALNEGKKNVNEYVNERTSTLDNILNNSRDGDSGESSGNDGDSGDSSNDSGAGE